MSQKIRIKLKSYDHNLVDKSAEKICKNGEGSLVLSLVKVDSSPYAHPYLYRERFDFRK